MPMTSREIIQRTLTCDFPARVARSFDDPDMVGVPYCVQTPETAWRETGPSRWERIDEWGNTWARVDPTSKGEVTAGALENLSGVDEFPFPDFSNPASYAPVTEKRRALPGKYLIGHMPGFTFNIARKLRRLDQYLVDILLEREAIRRLHDRIDLLLEQMIRNHAAAGADAVMFPEDWGTQQGLLIHPDLWREEFGQRYKNLCGLARECGIAVWMHSCGQIEAIVPDLIDAGIAVLQFDQPELHGIDVLAAHQDRRPITFWCPVDIQKTLPRKNAELIRLRAREMLEKLWRGRGGFIAGYYEDNASLGLEPEWQEIACAAFRQHETEPISAHG